MKIYKSKTLPGVTYESSKVGSFGYLTVKFSGKLITGGQFPVKRMALMKELERILPFHSSTLQCAAEGFEVDAMPLFNDLQVSYNIHRS